MSVLFPKVLFPLIILAFGFSSHLYAQEKASISDFELDLTAIEDGVYQAIGISLPGLPYEEALKQAESFARAWLSIGIDVESRQDREVNTEVINGQSGTEERKTHLRTMKLKGMHFAIPTKTKRIVRFDDGTVLVIMQGLRTKNMERLPDKPITGFVSDKEVISDSEKVEALEERSYSFNILTDGDRSIDFSGLVRSDSAFLKPDRTFKLSQQNQKPIYVEDPEWMNATDSYNYLIYGSSRIDFMEGGNTSIQLADAAILASLYTYMELNEKVDAKNHHLKRQFSDDLELADMFKDIRINNTEICRLKISGNSLFVQFRQLKK